jgi:NAD(P) transhydrogenase subunit alpha
MKISVPAETADLETRVAIVPETVSRLVRDGHQVTVGADAGAGAGFSDADYTEAGAHIATDTAAMLGEADVVLKVNAPTDAEIAQLRSGSVIAGQFKALTSAELLEKLSSAGVTTVSMELIPRIARAQRLDVLSSQASLAGYKAVLIAANSIGRFFPLMMTAAGTIPPANVLVLGAGVAGLQAIATAKRLGAVVEAYDVRAAVREQIESLGGTFVELESEEDLETAGGYAKEQTADAQQRQQEQLADHVAKADVVITTAQIPGKPAPVLVTAGAVQRMRTGSVIVDLAGETGGNCELTEPGATTTEHGVEIHAPLNVPAMMPAEASTLYSRNLQGLLELLADEDGALKVDLEDEVIAGATVTHDGALVGQVTHAA